MKLMLLLLVALLGSLMVSAVCLPIVFDDCGVKNAASEEKFFFGVSFGGNTTSEAKLLINRVKEYTNLFVINSWGISGGVNETALNEICDYAVSNGLNLMVYFNFIFYNYTTQLGNFYNSTSWELFGVTPWHMSWLNIARERWGNKFLGIYLYDEPGGKQIDEGYWYGGAGISAHTGRRVTTFANVSGYSDAAYRYVRSISRSGSMQHLINSSIPNSINSPMPVFTSDYALYWFDYLAGYDAIFAEFGWNYSRTQQIALCRGAAKVQNKQWGAIITWTYRNPPYLESGTDMLKDMMTAYRAGANYLIVFNYPKIKDNPYGILTEEHFAAMERFWNEIHSFPRSVFGEIEGQVAFVLPKDYGWGMRNPSDKIWGFWPPDDLSPLIWDKMSRLIERYGLKLDIIYDDPRFNFKEKYSKIHFWNSTIN